MKEPLRRRARALVDYTPPDGVDASSLSFRFGDVLLLESGSIGDATMMKASTPQGDSGLVPAIPAGLVALEGPRALVHTTFVGTHEGELTVQEGDLLSILYGAEGTAPEGWMLAAFEDRQELPTNLMAAIGYVPEAYIRQLDEAPPEHGEDTDAPWSSAPPTRASSVRFPAVLPTTTTGKAKASPSLSSSRSPSHRAAGLYSSMMMGDDAFSPSRSLISTARAEAVLGGGPMKALLKQPNHTRRSASSSALARRRVHALNSIERDVGRSAEKTPSRSSALPGLARTRSLNALGASSSSLTMGERGGAALAGDATIITPIKRISIMDEYFQPSPDLHAAGDAPTPAVERPERDEALVVKAAAAIVSATPSIAHTATQIDEQGKLGTRKTGKRKKGRRGGRGAAEHNEHDPSTSSVYDYSRLHNRMQRDKFNALEVKRRVAFNPKLAPPPPNGKMLPLMRYTANGKVIVERRLMVVEEEVMSEALRSKLDSWMERRGFDSPAPSRGGSPVPT